MELSFTPEEYAAMQAYPLPWWAPEPRNALGRVAGTPGTVADEDGNITEYRVNHHSIDHKDLFLLEILRAGWAYIADMTDAEQDYLQTLQATNDWANWTALKARLDDPDDNLTREGAIDLVWADIEAQAATLGLTYTEPEDLPPV